MKLTKTLWLAGLALFAASCSSDDMVDAPRSGNAISFDGIAVKNASRTYTELSSSNLTDFNVWANYYDTDPTVTTDVFNGAKIEYTGSAWGNSVVSEEQEWQAGKTYNFYAVAPAAENHNFTMSSTALYYENDGETDICSAKNTGIVAQAIGANQAVNLSFKHMLSRVRFQIENKSTDYTIKGNVKITNAVKHANLNCETLSWYDQGDNLELTFSFDEIAAVDNNTITTGTSTKNFLIPSDRTYWIIYDLTLVDGSNNETALDVNPIQLQLNNALGKSYTISASITGPQIVSNKIAFDPQIATADDWSEDWTNNSVTTIEDSNFDLLQLTAKSYWNGDNITWENNVMTFTGAGNAAIGWFNETVMDISEYKKIILELSEVSGSDVQLGVSTGGYWGYKNLSTLSQNDTKLELTLADLCYTGEYETTDPNLSDVEYVMSDSDPTEKWTREDNGTTYYKYTINTKKVDLTQVNLIILKTAEWVASGQTIKVSKLYLEK
ncbi:MAG: fimbrillin family protein [Bacteroidales bacterium]|nr:fimbrillin family protein [Bacteroidales bacterium]